jgi:hypothetical protein
MSKVFYKTGILQIIPPFVTPPGLLGPGAATVKHRKKQYGKHKLSAVFLLRFSSKNCLIFLGRQCTIPETNKNTHLAKSMS